LEKALIDTTEIWDEEEENEIEACSRYLGSSKEVPNQNIPLDELNGKSN